MSAFLLHNKLYCRYSGLLIGSLEVKTVAGALPYLSYWNDSLVCHPIFSLGAGRLLKFVEDEWRRIQKRPTEEDLTADEAELLQVSYLALLHSLECVKQDIPALPSLDIVRLTIEPLFKLAHWKWYLEGKIFLKFPVMHINKLNKNSDFNNIGHYLDACFDVKRNYEKNVKDADEKAKIKAAHDALVSLNNTWITPPSKRILWTWIKTHIDSKYKADTEGWLSTLFLGGSNAIIEFEEEDIDLAEEIIEAACPGGTGVLSAIRARLRQIRTIWDKHNNMWEVHLEDHAINANIYVNGIKVLAPDPGAEPKREEFIKVASFFVAQAKWKIAKAAWDADQKRLESGQAEQVSSTKLVSIIEEL